MPGDALALEDREEIRAGIEREESFAAIAVILGGPTSIVSREIDSNGGREYYRAARADTRGSRPIPSSPAMSKAA